MCLLTGIAYLGALVFNNWLAEKWSAPRLFGGKYRRVTGNQRRYQPPGGRLGNLIVGRNLFNANPTEEDGDGEDGEDADEEEEEKAPEAPPGQIPGPHEHCEESKAQVELNATLVAEPVERSMAALREEGEDRLASIGMEVADHTLVAVYRNKIILEDAGQYTCIKAGKRKSGSRKGRKSDKYSSRSGKDSRSSAQKKMDAKKIKEGIKKTGK